MIDGVVGRDQQGRHSGPRWNLKTQVSLSKIVELTFRHSKHLPAGVALRTPLLWTAEYQLNVSGGLTTCVFIFQRGLATLMAHDVFAPLSPHRNEVLVGVCYGCFMSA